MEKTQGEALKFIWCWLRWAGHTSHNEGLGYEIAFFSPLRYQCRRCGCAFKTPQSLAAKLGQLLLALLLTWGAAWCIASALLEGCCGN